jgi:hypothetical protein
VAQRELAELAGLLSVLGLRSTEDKQASAHRGQGMKVKKTLAEWSEKDSAALSGVK